MEIRSFLAFELPEEIKEIISRISGEMKKFDLDVRWVKVDNIHLTVIFIGNISIDRLDGMDALVREVCQGFSPFNITVRGTGVFSNRDKPRVLWIGLSGDIERLALFRDALQNKLRPLGIKKEKRPFNPHLTLGRFRKGARSGPHLDKVLSGYKELTSPVRRLNELVLFKSDLTPGGTVYTRLNVWPMAAEN